MSGDRDAVQGVMEELSPEAMQLLKKVLEIEKQNLHVKAADPTDEIVQVVKGLIQ